MSNLENFINIICCPLTVNLTVVFILNTLSTTLSNLKTVFLSKGIRKPVYLTTFIDSMVFIYAIKLVTEASGLGYIVVFAAGRLLGVFLGGWIESKLSLGFLEIVIFKHLKDGKLLADELRSKGFSVTTTIGYGVEGKERLVLNIVTPSSLFVSLQSILEQYGKVNMSVKPIHNVYGKVALKNINAIKN